MNDDEVAFRIVRLYFEEIARLGFKRQLDLDQILNAYFYTLKRLEKKDEEIKEIIKKITTKETKTENKEGTPTKTTITKTTEIQ
jgi:hypothetical protein